MKYWEILLQKHREKGKHGLTIPYLIGSQNYLSKPSYHQNIRELIEEMIKNDSFEKCLRYCLGTQTFIVEISKGKNAVYYPKINKQEQSNFSVGVFYKKDFTDDIDSLIQELENRFQEPIDNGFFSAEPNVDSRSVNWTKFTEKDILFIQNAFMSKG